MSVEHLLFYAVLGMKTVFYSLEIYCCMIRPWSSPLFSPTCSYFLPLFSPNIYSTRFFLHLFFHHHPLSVYPFFWILENSVMCIFLAFSKSSVERHQSTTDISYHIYSIFQWDESLIIFTSGYYNFKYLIFITFKVWRRMNDLWDW